jgi:hypothetical protein
MQRTGWRFSWKYRRGDTWRHRLVYRLVDTGYANWLAGDRYLSQAEIAKRMKDELELSDDIHSQETNHGDPHADRRRP